jgi:integrase
MPAKGDGISKRKDGRYMARYTIHTPDGPKRKTIYGRKYKEVEKKLAEARGNAARGLTFDAGNLTIGEWLDRWLQDAVADTVRPVTFAKYEQIVRNHAKPALGRLRLQTLNPAHVRGLYREKLDSGLSPRTVQYIHVTLNKALKQAVMDGLIPRNVCEAVKPPRPQKREIAPLSPGQARRFLKACQGERLEALFVLAVHTGMRQGELLGLHWEDVDLQAGALRVRMTLAQTNDGPVLAAPKSAKSRRRIKLTGASVEALKRHRAAQHTERRKIGGLWEDRGLVFPNRIGGFLSPYLLTDGPLKRPLERAGLPTIRFHDLRHTCATILLSRGVHAKLVQELLGHATISITLDTYSHVLPGMDDRLADAMDDALS